MEKGDKRRRAKLCAEAIIFTFTFTFTKTTTLWVVIVLLLCRRSFHFPSSLTFEFLNTTATFWVVIVCYCLDDALSLPIFTNPRTVQPNIDVVGCYCYVIVSTSRSFVLPSPTCELPRFTSWPKSSTLLLIARYDW